MPSNSFSFKFQNFGKSIKYTYSKQFSLFMPLSQPLSRQWHWTRPSWAVSTTVVPRTRPASRPPTCPSGPKWPRPRSPWWTTQRCRWPGAACSCVQTTVLRSHPHWPTCGGKRPLARLPAGRPFTRRTGTACQLSPGSGTVQTCPSHHNTKYTCICTVLNKFHLWEIIKRVVFINLFWKN